MTARRWFWPMLVAALAVCALMPMTAQAADPVSYIECGWDGSKVTKTPKTVSDYTQVTAGTTTFNDGAWYVVSEDVTVSDRILRDAYDCSGTVNLILCDGATLTAQKGIWLPSNAKLNIYAQERGTGKLTAKGVYKTAGIGGGDGAGTSSPSGTLTIHGGTIMATGGEQGAGIGGGWLKGCGPVTIYDGTVTAEGSNVGAGAGIGGGWTGDGHNGGGSRITIYGGKVTATGGQSNNEGGAGIGGGDGGAGGNVLIYGGEVTATGGQSAEESGAGIGGGAGRGGGDVFIYGGVVNANGGASGGEVGAKGIGAGSGATNQKNLTIGPQIRLFGDDDRTPATTTRHYVKNEVSEYTGERYLHMKVAYVEPVSYLEWDSSSQRLVEKTVSDYALVDENTREFKDDWYVVSGRVTNNNRLTVTGSAHIVLEEGAKMFTYNGGIRVDEGNSLSIYAQSTNKNTMGYIYAEGSGDGAAIGGNRNSNGGEITIHGGSFYLLGHEGGGAALGGGSGGSGGTITIYSGDIDAIGGRSGGAGIGGGNGGSGGRIEIYGGEHSIEGRAGSAGIGGGLNGDGDWIGIYGGKVLSVGDNAYGDTNKYGMGIGQGYGGSGNGVLEVGSGLYVYGGSGPNPSTNILPDDGEYERQQYMAVNNTVPPHSHAFSYSAEGAVITATCIGPRSCPQHYDEGVALTISAEGGPYDGTTSYGASLEGLENFNSITGQTASEEQIEYYQGSVKLDSAPVNAGTYTAKITVKRRTASLDFTVDPLPSEVTVPPTANELSFTGEPQELVTAGEASNGTMQYALGNADGALAEFSASVPTATRVGTYYVWYKAKGDVNYKDTEPECVTVAIKPVKYTVTFKDEDGTVLLKEEYAEGTPAAGIARPADPAKPDDGQYTYAFAGWDPEITDVTADAVYTAVYTRSEIPTPDDPTPDDPEPDPKPDPAPAPGSDPNQMGSDGTPVGPGASAAAADKAITTMKKDADPKGSVFGKLKLRSTKQSKTSVKLSWSKVGGAAKYVVYGNKCGKTSKPVKLATTTGAGKTLKKVAGKKVKKGTYYKFIVVALDRNGNVVSTSKLIHVATKGGKVGNDGKVTVPKQALSKAKKLKKGKSLKLGAKASPQSKKLKVKRHVKMRYESTNAKVATVSSKGAVKAKAKGTCYVYAYAQDGVYKKVKVTVK